MAISKLNNEGQLVSEILDKAPLDVKSIIVVDNLNADLLDGTHESSMLRTDADRTLNANKTLTVEGTVHINDTGSLKIGNFALKETDGIFHIDYIGT